MLGRYIYGEIAHRKGIYREALNLLRNGWHVMANHIPGFHTPPEIEGYIPDIYAVKDHKTYIIDLMTYGSPDWEGYEAHNTYASHDPSTEYFCWVLDAAGCRQAHFA
jgi:hypothetical protein